MHRRALLAGLAFAPAAFANVAPPELAAELPGARVLGRGRLRFLGMAIYDAQLWAAAPPADPLAEPLALEIIYARSLVGRLIAERSLAEMKRQGPIDDAQGQRWLQAMTQLFPDVAAGDRLTGIHRPGSGARFFHNGRSLGDVAEPEFARRFFGIWLGAQTSEPALRDALLGRR